MPKKICSGQMGHFGSENGTFCNSGLAVRFLKKFCRMRGANRYMEILLVVFQEKNSFGAIRSFLAFRPFFTV